MTIDNYFKNKSVAVAFSGGVDSAVLLMLAVRYAKRVKAYYVKSAFQPQFELDDAREIVQLLGAELDIITLDILGDAQITANPANRCYYCKKRIFTAICSAAERDGFDCVCDGTNASDNVADRPGFKALKELGVESPLRDCGYTKTMIRTLARENALPVADKCSYACLATRIPTGVEITGDLLNKTEAAENELRSLGFHNFRVRYLDGAAKLELSTRDIMLYNSDKDSVDTMLLKYYNGVYLDSKERNDE
ncbi:MAG: ATP-dependent sacrificial sulfur transferase LarE [Eubacterium sp.]|nr:ATP-dependent sacrificial sulfur transferase LarE [Eubacterium sp.]